MPLPDAGWTIYPQLCCLDKVTWKPIQCPSLEAHLPAQFLTHGHPPELIDVLVGELFIMFFQTDCGVVLAQTDCAAAYSYGLAAGELPAGARMPPNLKEQRI